MLHKNKPAYVWGVFCSFSSAFIWGTSHISGRWLMSNRCIDVLSLCCIRYTCGGLFLLAAGMFFQRRKILSVKFRDLLLLNWLAFLGIVAHSALLLLGQAYTTATNSSLILALNPVMAMFIGLFLGYRINFFKAFGTGLSLLGCLMVVGVISRHGFDYSSNHLFGDAITLVSAFFWALYMVFSAKTAARLGGFTITVWTMLAGAVQFLLLRIFLPIETHIPAWEAGTQWLVIFYVVFFPTAVGFYFWYEAMSKIELSLLNIMQYLTPIATIILSYFILHEKMTALNVIGAMLIFSGVMIASGLIRLPLKRKNCLFAGNASRV
ncbi:MAG: DMT family transporter [Victivallaceae bacterium]